MAPTNAQRLDYIEHEMEALRSSISDQVAAAVADASHSMQQALTTQIATSIEQAIQKLGNDLSTRLEGRLNQSQENQAVAIAQLKRDQVALREEMRNSTLPYRPEHAPPHSASNVMGAGQESIGERVGGFAGGFAGGRANWRYKKLDLPLFDGNNPDGWIMRAERYFNFYRLGDEEKVEAAVVALEGDALLWFQWENKRRPICRWEEMKCMILRLFRSMSSGTLYEQWLANRQGGSVFEYRRRFIELMAPLEGVPEEIAMGQFVNGLKDDIKAEVRVLGPKTLDQAMDLAMKIEEKGRVGSNNPKWRGPGPNSYKGTNSPNSNFTYPKTSAPSISPLSSYPPSVNSSPYYSYQRSLGNPATKPVGEVRRLSEKELQEKREKGLCFRCDEKWSVNHRCRRKELSILLSQVEDEGVFEEGEILSPGSDGLEEAQCEPVQTGVSLNSVLGLTNPKTLKLRGTVDGQEVVVMVDPGATHNLVSTETVARLKLPVTTTKVFGVTLGNDETVQGEGECKSVTLQLQGATVVEDFFPLPLGNSDMILGIQWLEKLGTMMTN
ncbi:Retrotransposon-derived protein PEG10 [Bienertia sinuspersici]